MCLFLRIFNVESLCFGEGRTLWTVYIEFLNKGVQRSLYIKHNELFVSVSIPDIHARRNEVQGSHILTSVGSGKSLMADLSVWQIFGDGDWCFVKVTSQTEKPSTSIMVRRRGALETNLHIKFRCVSVVSVHTAKYSLVKPVYQNSSSRAYQH